MSGVFLVFDTTCVSTSGNSCSWTVPTGVYSVTFEAWGGGGGGGVSGTNCDCCSHGGGGGGGGYSKKTILTSPGTVYSICAGPGGISSVGWGAYCGICCNGCAGGTSYITGTGLSNFCATGGTGGPSDFNTNCYGHCGCNFYSFPGGIGYGGDVVASGLYGTMGHLHSSNPYNIIVFGGGAAGPGGGQGGVNQSYCVGYGCNAAGEHPLNGRIPGGGGAGSGFWSCCVCTPWASGKGAPGLVKVTY